MIYCDRDKLIDATICNLLLAGIILPHEAAGCMKRLASCAIDDVAACLLESHTLLEEHKQNVIEWSKN